MTRRKGYLVKQDRRNPNRPWGRLREPGFRFLEPFHPKGPDYTILALKSSLSKFNKSQARFSTLPPIRAGYQILMEHQMIEVYEDVGQDPGISRGPPRRRQQPFFFGSYGPGDRWTIRVMPEDVERSQYPAHDLRRRILKASYLYVRRKSLSWKLSAAVIDNGNQVECVWIDQA